MIYFWLKLFHIVATSIWFGVNLMQTGDIRRVLNLGKPHTDILPERINKIHRVSVVSGFLTIASGFAMIFFVGGFANVRAGIHAGLGLTLLLYAVEYFAVMTAWKKLQSALSAGNLDASRAAAKRYSMGIGIGHMLRTMIFVLMVVQF